MIMYESSSLWRNAIMFTQRVKRLGSRDTRTRLLPEAQPPTSCIAGNGMWNFQTIDQKMFSFFIFLFSLLLADLMLTNTMAPSVFVVTFVQFFYEYTRQYFIEVYY